MQWLSTTEDAIPEGLGWLSALEASRIDDIRFTKRRTEYLLRRAVGKLAATTVLGLDRSPQTLARVELLNRMSGAPYVLVDGAASTSRSATGPALPSPW